jgi:hypothetical protein
MRPLVASLAISAVQLQITLDPRQLLLREEKGTKKGGLNLLFLQKDSAGSFLAAEKRHFDVRFDAREYSAVARTGLVLQRHLAILPDAAEIRVVVRDLGSASLGSVTVAASKLL